MGSPLEECRNLRSMHNFESRQQGLHSYIIDSVPTCGFFKAIFFTKRAYKNSTYWNKTVAYLIPRTCDTVLSIITTSNIMLHYQLFIFIKHFTTANAATLTCKIKQLPRNKGKSSTLADVLGCNSTKNWVVSNYLSRLFRYTLCSTLTVCLTARFAFVDS